jgi:hypothetical protein
VLQWSIARRGQRVLLSGLLLVENSYKIKNVPQNIIDREPHLYVVVDDFISSGYKNL